MAQFYSGFQIAAYLTPACWLGWKTIAVSNPAKGDEPLSERDWEVLRLGRVQSNPVLAMEEWISQGRPHSRPPICKGCTHYHGELYLTPDGWQCLVCGVHPYGQDGEACPDWEG